MTIPLIITTICVASLAYMTWLAASVPKRTCIYPHCSNSGSCLNSCTRPR